MTKSLSFCKIYFMKLPIVAIVGRPNTGKSTLFNKILGKRKAIVDDIPGVTRDWLTAEIEWKKKKFVLVDTGGFDPDSKEEIGKLVYLQTQRAIEESDVIIMLMDGKEGLNPLDKELCNYLRGKKMTFYVVNKMDTKQAKNQFYDFYSLGVERIFPISAEHNTGIDELMEEVVKALPDAEEEETITGRRIAIIGRPNVGKSSIMNRLLGKERSIVTPIPGTTRDAIEEKFEWKGKNYILVDTAGIRRKSRVERGIEFFSVQRAIDSIKNAEIVILIVDIFEGIVQQDLKLLSLCLENGKGVCIALNKADLIKKSQRKKILQLTKETLKFADFVPYTFTSAITGEGINELMGIISLIEEEMKRKVRTSLLNQWLREVIKNTPPPKVEGRRGFVLYYSVQTSSFPPTFLLFCNDPSLLTEEYKVFLERKIREKFPFTGLPIFLKVKKSE